MKAIWDFRCSGKLHSWRYGDRRISCLTFSVSTHMHHLKSFSKRMLSVLASKCRPAPFIKCALDALDSLEWVKKTATAFLVKFPDYCASWSASTKISFEVSLSFFYASESVFRSFIYLPLCLSLKIDHCQRANVKHFENDEIIRARFPGVPKFKRRENEPNSPIIFRPFLSHITRFRCIKRALLLSGYSVYFVFLIQGKKKKKWHDGAFCLE